MEAKNIYGYVRVSSKDQNTERQLIALHDFGVADRNIFTEIISGKDFNRPQFKKLIRKLRQDDMLIIKSIDRLGRNYNEIIEVWRHVTKVIKADIVVMDMPLLDTREGKDLMGRFIADLVLQILSYVAQNERDNIRQRQKEGIAAAKARGTHFGRQEKTIPDNFKDIYALWSVGEISGREAARRLNVTHPTFAKWAKWAKWAKK